MPDSIQAKTILNKTKRRDPWFLDEYTINPYSGCSFNCLYCYIRGSKYGNHTEIKTSIKENAVALLEKQLALRAKRQQYGFIVVSSATDPYLHFEKETLLTRQILECILQYRFPVHIITKSDLVTRDFDLLKKIDTTAILPDDLREKLNRGTIISFSFSTIDDTIAAVFEPGANPPSLRLQTMISAVQAGFKTGISLMPLLPFISDNGPQLEELFSTFNKAGCHYVLPATLTLFGDGPSDSKTLVLKAVEKHYPALLEKYQQFFSGSNQMPAYYQQAFSKKMKELSEKYGLKMSIL